MRCSGTWLAWLPVPGQDQIPGRTCAVEFRRRTIVPRLSLHSTHYNSARLGIVACSVPERHLIKIGGEHSPSSSAAPRTTDSRWGVEETFRGSQVQSKASTNSRHASSRK